MVQVINGLGIYDVALSVFCQKDGRQLEMDRILRVYASSVQDARRRAYILTYGYLDYRFDDVMIGYVNTHRSDAKSHISKGGII